MIRRLFSVLAVVLVALSIGIVPAHADFDPWTQDLTELGYGTPREDYYCKDFGEASEEEQNYFYDVLRKNPESHEAKLILDSFASGLLEIGAANLCFNLDGEERQVCLGAIFDSSRTCFNMQGERQLQNPLPGWAEDPIGSVVDTAAYNLAEEIVGGMVQGMFTLLTSWLLDEGAHVDLSTNAAQVFYPMMVWIGGFLAFLMLVWQGLRMMFARRVDVLTQTVRGLVVCAAVTACGVGVLGALISLADALTKGVIDFAFGQLPGEGWACEAPEGIAADIESAAPAGEYAAENMLLKCATASVDFGNVGNAAMVIVFGIIGLIMMLIQFLLLFVREAALPLIALLIPIAAAGQIGGMVARKWLSGLLALTLTVVLYKPMIALIMAVGFAQAIAPDSETAFLRGMLTMLVGVVAPGVLMKAFAPLMAAGVEQGASAGSVINNVALTQQITSHVRQHAEQRAATRAARRAARGAEKGAAEAAAGVGSAGVALLAERVVEKGAEAATGGDKAVQGARAGKAAAGEHEGQSAAERGGSGQARPNAHSGTLTAASSTQSLAPGELRLRDFPAPSVPPVPPVSPVQQGAPKVDPAPPMEEQRAPRPVARPVAPSNGAPARSGDRFDRVKTPYGQEEQ
ncbi:hypothetical protein GCM10027294_53200 [Marinactinospora endophytica]